MNDFGIWSEISAPKPANTLFANVSYKAFKEFHWTAKDDFVSEAVDEIFLEWPFRPGTAWVGAIGTVSGGMAPWNAIGVAAVAFSSIEKDLDSIRAGNGYFTATLALAKKYGGGIHNLYANVHGGGYNVSDVGLKDAPRRGIPVVNFSPIADSLSWIEWHYGHSGDKIRANYPSAGHWWTLEEVVNEIVGAVDSMDLGILRGVAGCAVNPMEWKSE